MSGINLNIQEHVKATFHHAPPNWCLTCHSPWDSAHIALAALSEGCDGLEAANRELERELARLRATGAREVERILERTVTDAPPVIYGEAPPDRECFCCDSLAVYLAEISSFGSGKALIPLCNYHLQRAQNRHEALTWESLAHPSHIAEGIDADYEARIADVGLHGENA